MNDWTAHLLLLSIQGSTAILSCRDDGGPERPKNLTECSPDLLYQ
ncbi:MAG TPA: hypothetical protein VMT00_08525 [Thermoanaerobaculia bacterium]|nr:hypothetical protein [Thermoanaerobaculia bacterium]